MILWLFPISVLHQTTTKLCNKIQYKKVFPVSFYFYFYIKPQHRNEVGCLKLGVSCIRSTSNHNRGPIYHERGRLFPVSVLHQTTTYALLTQVDFRCFLYLFYIKPQLSLMILSRFSVVPHIRSTSNHNASSLFFSASVGVSCIRSTSNHNFAIVKMHLMPVFPVSVLHQTTTLRYTSWCCTWLFPVSILHQTTTSVIHFSSSVLLFPVSILHQTTTSWSSQ